MMSMVNRFISVWVRPFDALREIKENGAASGFWSTVVYVLILGVISGLISATMGIVFWTPNPYGYTKAQMWLAAFSGITISTLLTSFIVAGAIWGLVFGFLNSQWPQYKLSYLLFAAFVAFSPASALFSPIPKVGFWIGLAINLWAAIVLIKGIIIVFDTRPLRTWILCVLLGAIVALFAFQVRQEALRNTQPNLAEFGAGLDEEPFGDLGLEEEPAAATPPAKAQ